MSKRYKCVSCSVYRCPVYVRPKVRKDGTLACPNCGSMELESVYTKH